MAKKRDFKSYEVSVEIGSSQSFWAAIEAGADAITVELEGATPHPSAHAFSIAEYTKALETANKRKVKIYLSLDYAYKDSDIQELARTLEMIKSQLPSAFIVGDLGIAHLIRQNYNAPVFSGSLLSAHNLAAVEFLRKQRFSRVRLSPFLTRAELAKIARQSKCELSIQVHGDLCFSYRELCYASSFFTGRSSLRRDCHEICRRPYMKRNELGYWLSPRDLELIEEIAGLKRLGIREFTIAGFSRPPEYIYRTVKAYRIVKDSKGKEQGKTVAEAKDLLTYDLGRPKTRAILGDSTGRKTIEPKRPPVVGLLIGRIESVSRGRASLTSEYSVSEGDRLKLIGQGLEDGPSFSVRELKSKRLDSLSKISFKVPETARAGDFVFKVSSSKDAIPKSWNSGLKSDSDSAIDFDSVKESAARKLSSIYARLNHPPKVSQRPRRHRYRIEVWGRLRLSIKLPRDTGLVVDFREDVDKLSEELKKRTVLSMPTVITEDEWARLRTRVERLLAKGFYHWQIGHPAQIEMFRQARFTSRRLEITCAPTCNVFNLLSVQVLLDQGVLFIILPWEADLEVAQELGRKGWKSRLGIMSYGWPPLMLSRIEAFEESEPFTLFGRDWTFKVSPKRFTVVRPREPFCAPSSFLKAESSRFAFLQLQVDSKTLTHRDELNAIIYSIRKKRGVKKTEQFNLKKGRRI